MNKPSGVSVISKRVELRRASKEWTGLCPFHADKTPSFSVSEEKGLFHCFACGESGDVFDFIMKLDGVSFVEAVKSLGGDPDYRPQRPTISREAIIITDWCNAQFAKAQSLLREIGQRMQLAKDLAWTDEVERLSREWKILSIFADDLQNPKLAISLFESREAIENILQDAEPEPLPSFPEITPEYFVTSEMLRTR
jgi:CHC2 zinc finger